MEIIPLKMFWWCLAIFSKRDCLHSTTGLEREGIICPEEKVGADTQFWKNADLVWTSKSYSVRGNVLLIPNPTTLCKHVILLFLRHASHSRPTILTPGQQFRLFAHIIWNEAHKWPKITKAFPWAGKKLKSIHWIFPFICPFCISGYVTWLQSISHFNA